MTAILGRTGNLVGFSTGRGTTPWDTEMEAALRKMDAMLASTVVAITNTLPGSANEGDLFLVGTLPTGVAAGWANRIARWRSSPAGWEAYQPMQGWIITIVGESTNKVRRYNGTAWVPLITDIGAEPALPAGGTANDYLTGAKAWTNFASAARSVILTGLSTASSAVVVATDTILQAIGKLQAQVSLRLPIDNPTYTGTLRGQLATFGTATAGGGGKVVVQGDDNADNGFADLDWNSGVGGTSRRRMTARWEESIGSVAVFSSNDDGSSRANRLRVYRDSSIPVRAYAGFDVNSGDLLIGNTVVVDSFRNISGATLKATNGVGTGVRPAVFGADGTLDDQDAATFRGTIEVSRLLSLSGAIDFNSINGGAPCVATGDGTSYANSPYLGTQLVGYGGTLYQGEGASGSITQLWADVRTGSMYYRGKTSGTWGPWVQVYDGYNTPISTFAKTLLDDASSTAARATLSAAPLAGAEVLIHSDFGRSATTDVWQSAFANNAASGLQLAANSIASGTEIIIEQVANLPGDGGNSTYQVYIGPQLTGDNPPMFPRYVDVLDPEVDYGEGKLCIKIELIGSGDSITGYVTSTWIASNSTTPTVRYGTLTVDGTIANSIDVRFNPQSVTSYIIRRNRVRRCNP